MKKNSIWYSVKLFDAAIKRERHVHMCVVYIDKIRSLVIYIYEVSEQSNRCGSKKTKTNGMVIRYVQCTHIHIYVCYCIHMCMKYEVSNHQRWSSTFTGRTYAYHIISHIFTHWHLSTIVETIWLFDRRELQTHQIYMFISMIPLCKKLYETCAAAWQISYEQLCVMQLTKKLVFICMLVINDQNQTGNGQSGSAITNIITISARIIDHLEGENVRNMWS